MKLGKLLLSGALVLSTLASLAPAAMADKPYRHAPRYDDRYNHGYDCDDRGIRYDRYPSYSYGYGYGYYESYPRYESRPRYPDDRYYDYGRYERRDRTSDIVRGAIIGAVVGAVIGR